MKPETAQTMQDVLDRALRRELHLLEQVTSRITTILAQQEALAQEQREDGLEPPKHLVDVATPDP